MAKTAVQQTSFASGELTPLIFGRVDREIYANGAARLRNVRVTPLGGTARRYGTQYIDTTTDSSVCRLVPFSFNTEQEYLIVFTEGEFKVYKDGVLQATVSSSPISGLTETIISEMNWTQSADTLLIVHETIQPIKITRTSDTAWTAVNQTFTGYDDSTNGWPRTITFWQQRLWFGGAQNKPQTVYSSKIADFFDFTTGSNDADGIEFTIDDDQVNAIVNIFAGRTLQVFTTGGEFFTPLLTTNKVTPDTVSIEKATRHGSEDSGVRPLSNDGATMFVSKGGRVVREYVFLEVEQSYVTEDISFLSEHLIQNPVSADIQRGSNFAAEYSYFVNGDGTMAVLNRRRAQSFLAWTLYETDGEYEQVAVVDNEVYVCVKRTIDSAIVRYIEKFDADYYTDAGIILTDTATTSWSGLGHLEGEDVNVRSQDGYPLLPQTVSSGAITTESEQTDIEVGLPWQPIIRTLPPNAEVQGKGNIIGSKRRIVSANFNLYESNGFFVSNGTTSSRISVLSLGNINFGQVTPKFSGWKKSYFRGYSREPYIEITQDLPLDLNILSLNMEVTI